MNNIADFAENLILNEVKSISEGKTSLHSTTTSNPTAAPAGKDIRGTQVPDSMMREILGEAFHPQDTPPVDAIPQLVWTDSEEEKEAPKPTLLSEEGVEELIVLLREVKELLSEMTAATTGSGQVGINLAGESGEGVVSRQKGYPSARKATLPSNFSTKNILRQSIRRRISR